MQGRSSAGERRKRVDTRRLQVTLESGMALLLQELPCITRLGGAPKSEGCEGGVRGEGSAQCSGGYAVVGSG